MIPQSIGHRCRCRIVSSWVYCDWVAESTCYAAGWQRIPNGAGKHDDGWDPCQQVTLPIFPSCVREHLIARGRHKGVFGHTRHDTRLGDVPPRCWWTTEEKAEESCTKCSRELWSVCSHVSYRVYERRSTDFGTCVKRMQCMCHPLSYSHLTLNFPSCTRIPRRKGPKHPGLPR